MLKGEKFDAFALKLCFGQSMLSIKCIFAYYQMCFCLLSNVNMIAVKCNQKSYFIIKKMRMPLI